MNSRRLLKDGLHALLGDDAAWLYAMRLWWRTPRAPKQKREIALVTRLVQNGDIAIDVGANSADWTYALSRRVGATGKVFAFEADPFYPNITAKTIRLLNLQNVSFFDFGLADAPRTAQLLIRNQEDERVAGTSHIVEQVTPEMARKTVSIRLEQLDALAQTYPAQLQSRFIKCDVEGYEFAVLRGAMELLQRARPLLCIEIGNGSLHGFHHRTLYQFLRALDYSSFGLKKIAEAIIPIQAYEIPASCLNDVLFVPNELRAVVAHLN